MEKSNGTKMKNHWVVHWFLNDRDGIVFTDIEKFHIKIFEKYKYFILSNIDKITISFAKTDKTNPLLIQYIEKTLAQMFYGKEIVFQIRNNIQRVGEFQTFRDDVLMNIGTNEKILYTHIKGSYRIKAEPRIMKGELLWILNMYRVVFSKQLVDSLDYFIMSGPDFSIYDASFHTIKSKRWDPHLHILQTYLLPLKSKLDKVTKNQSLIKYVNAIDQFKIKKPWAYLGTFYWMNMDTLGSYLKSSGFSKNDIISIVNEFQKYDRVNLPSSVTNLNGHKSQMSFANNVSEYFLPSIVDMKNCSLFKLKD